MTLGVNSNDREVFMSGGGKFCLLCRGSCVIVSMYPDTETLFEVKGSADLPGFRVLHRRFILLPSDGKRLNLAERQNAVCFTAEILRPYRDITGAVFSCFRKFCPVT